MNPIFPVKFECQPQCANCCRLSGGYVFLKEDEASRIARRLEISEQEFLDFFCRFYDDQLCLVDGENDHCVFLENSICSIYEVRPEQCRTYPFWPENLKSFARWRLTADECPGIGRGKEIPNADVKAFLNDRSLNSLT